MLQLDNRLLESDDRTLVVGGGGFIGLHVIDALQKTGLKLRVIDFAPPPTGLKKVEWITGSISDNTLVSSVINGCKNVIFLANASLPGSSQGNLACEAIGHIGTTLNVAEICKDLDVKRFLFASSGGTVYGYDSPPGGLMETDHTRPLNGYGVSKLSIEHYLRLMGAQSSMRTLCLRISNPYGEGQRAHRAQGVVAAAMQHAIMGTTMPIWGDGSIERDFIHVDDVAQAFVAALSYDGLFSVINIGSGEARSINSILAAIRRHSGRELAVNYQQDRHIDVHRNELSIVRALTELGWSPKIDLDEGLSKTVFWWRKEFGQET